MRMLLLIGALFLTVTLTGCDGGSSMVSQDEMNDPSIGKKAVEQLGPMPTAKMVKKGSAAK